MDIIPIILIVWVISIPLGWWHLCRKWKHLYEKWDGRAKRDLLLSATMLGPATFLTAYLLSFTVLGRRTPPEPESEL